VVIRTGISGAGGVDGVFEQVAEITDWIYRD